MAHRKVKYVDHKRVWYTPLDAIRDAAGFMVRFFAFSNIKHAFRTVIGGFKEFAVFFLAVFITQLLFWCPMLAMHARADSVKNEAYASADYHILIDGMSDDEWTYYYNKNFIVPDTYDEKDRDYKSYEWSEYKDGIGDTRYELKILLRSDEYSASENFMINHPISGENVSIEYSPRTSYLDELVRIKTVFIPVIIAMGLLSAIILFVLYNIRINHYKFRYGIYMSFGAGFEKLFQTAMWEMFSIAIITFIPALITAVAIRLSVSGAFFFDMKNVLWSFVWMLSVIMLAVFPSVKFLATRTPTSLIIAGDNSNYVSSPRVSFKIFRKEFPTHYELFGFWRFRRYYATLLVSAIIFTSLFICGFFVDSIVTASETTIAPEYTLNANGLEEVDPYLIEDIGGIDGVDCVSWENSIDATAINAYVALNNRQRAGISSKTVKTDQGYADNNFKYCRLDELLYSQVTRDGGWKIEGDLSRVMSENNCVAVSEYINNTEALNFKVGDEITLAVCIDVWGKINYDVPDNKYLLNQLLDRGTYEFITVEIAAIVDTGDTDDRYMIAMSDSLFYKAVSEDVSADKINVYLDSSLTHGEIKAVYESIRSLISDFDEVSISKNYSGLKYAISNSSSISPIIMLCAILVLAVSPPVWFFSQSMFGSKRKTENEMLSAFGATDKDLGKLYIFSGASLIVPAVAVTALLGWGVTELVYSFINEFLTSLGMGAGFRYTYKFSFVGLIICVVISSISAIMSTYIPFAKWKKERERIAHRHLGE